MGFVAINTCSMTLKCGLNTVVIILGSLNLAIAYAGEITDSEHRTKAATEKLPALVCYRCDTMVDGEKCVDLNDNSSSYHSMCSDDARICQVKRISMTTIAKTGEMTGKLKVWMLQRNCTGTCDPGCIIIGERTKLYSCTTCCEESFCNSGSSADSSINKTRFQLDLLFFYMFSLIFAIKT